MTILLTTKQVAERYTKASRTIERWASDASTGFPRPVRINGRCHYVASELDQWDRAQVERRDAKPSPSPDGAEASAG